MNLKICITWGFYWYNAGVQRLVGERKGGLHTIGTNTPLTGSPWLLVSFVVVGSAISNDSPCCNSIHFLN
jgi:hypothetical protein